jgi:hypothetical protein
MGLIAQSHKMYSIRKILSDECSAKESVLSPECSHIALINTHLLMFIDAESSLSV